VDRRLASRSMRAGLAAASLAVAVFAVAFVFAMLYG
jgi:hypothetical protein